MCINLDCRTWARSVGLPCAELGAVYVRLAMCCWLAGLVRGWVGGWQNRIGSDIMMQLVRDQQQQGQHHPLLVVAAASG